jgi:DNA-binding SARP family transcriptional activator/tetratricopeptide (TPR) repeat protein
MRVRLLGSVDVVVDGAPRLIQGVRRKALLATLALHDGEVVGTDRLAHVIWGEMASPGSASTLQSHMSFLRGVLGSRTAILARPPGYVLELGGGDTDVREAERLLRAGTRSPNPSEGIDDLEAALALWRGPPLADVHGMPWLEEQAQRLEVLLGHVKRALFEARLAAGEHIRLVPDLVAMAAEQPLDEQVCGQLMLALYRSGRQAEALAAYQRMRRSLGDLGIDPGAELRDLQTAILRQDPALEPLAMPMVSLAPVVVRTPVLPVPAQLPSAVGGFAGRAAELARLDELLRRALGARGRPAAVVIAAVSGMAGVGKTALAVHWAHRVAGRFPDGQLYVNLRGFDPGGAAVEPGEAVRGFLDALGVPAARIPDGLDAQATLYRSLLRNKRVLVVLDNARDGGQVRPLLPGSPGSLAVVTSRRDLADLVAAEGAYPLALDVLADAEAGDLLARRLGGSRAAGEPDAIAQIVDRCARLPLALAIAAARAADRPEFPLAVLTAELLAAARALDPFDGGDAATDVRAVFSWSYQALSEPAARLFRLLGVHPGQDVALPAAASLASIEPEQARLLLAELTRAHLIAEHAPGRFALHDLLRAYAAELVDGCESEEARGAALHNVLDHYLQTAHRAAMRLEPYLEPISLDPPRPQVTSGAPKTAEAALAWCSAEQAALIAAVGRAAEAGLDTHAWQLAWSLSSFLLRRALWSENAAVQWLALDAARRSGDDAGEAHALTALAFGYARAGRDSDAMPVFRRALRLFEQGGSNASQADIHRQLAWLAERQGQPAEMLSHSQRALELYRAADHQAGQAGVLNDLGWCHAMLGEYRQALDYCQRALAALAEVGERSWEDAVWDSLGYIHHQLGNHAEAVTCYRRSVALCRDLADRYNEAVTLDHLGDVQLSAGDAAAARRTWDDALRILAEIGHPDADQIRVKMLEHDPLLDPTHQDP